MSSDTPVRSTISTATHARGLGEAAGTDVKGPELKKTQTVLQYKLVSRFDRLRERLLADDRDPRLDRPLAYWALSNDRRLPLVFLGRQLRDLLQTPFEQLCTTPGVGEKKLDSLLNLLERAVGGQDAPQSGVCPIPAGEPLLPGQEGFDSDGVSESTWGQWCETVRRNGLLNEPLGRFTTTLLDLPNVLWMTPLSAYVDATLTEIRARKAHGDKRVHAIIEIFGTIQALLSTGGSDCHLAVQILPRRMHELNAWTIRVLANEARPDTNELRQHFVEPLLKQIRNDAGEVVIDLVSERLQIPDDVEASVRQSAGRLGVTRARVYQLLNDASRILQVRWPQGQFYLERLSEQYPAAEYRVFHTAFELFYPTRRVDPSTESYRDELNDRAPEHTVLFSP